MDAATRTLTTFFTIAYAWAWLIFVPMVILRARPEWIAVASFGPTIAALITHRLATGSFRAFRLYTTRLRTVAATVLGAVLVVFAYAVLPALITADPRDLQWSVFASLAVYNYSTFLGGPLGEEPGWRGYALPRMEDALGPVWAALALGLLWTGWHLPLFFYPGWTSTPLWIYTIFLTGQSVILAYGTNLARFGSITPIVMHAMFNTTSRFLGGLFSETQPSAPVPFELVMALSGVAVAGTLVLVTRGRLAYTPVHGMSQRAA